MQNSGRVRECRTHVCVCVCVYVYVYVYVCMYVCVRAFREGLMQNLG